MGFDKKKEKHHSTCRHILGTHFLTPKGRSELGILSCVIVEIGKCKALQHKQTIICFLSSSLHANKAMMGFGGI